MQISLAIYLVDKDPEHHPNPDGVMDLRLELDEVYKGCEKILDTGYGQFKLIVPGTRHGTKFNHGKGPNAI